MSRLSALTLVPLAVLLAGCASVPNIPKESPAQAAMRDQRDGTVALTWTPQVSRYLDSGGAPSYLHPDGRGRITLRSFLDLMVSGDDPAYNPETNPAAKAGYCRVPPRVGMWDRALNLDGNPDPGVGQRWASQLSNRSACAYRTGAAYRAIAAELPANWAMLPVADAYRAVALAAEAAAEQSTVPQVGSCRVAMTHADCDTGLGMLTFVPNGDASAIGAYNGTATLSSVRRARMGDAEKVTAWWPVGSAEVIEWSGK